MVCIVLIFNFSGIKSNVGEACSVDSECIEFGVCRRQQDWDVAICICDERAYTDNVTCVQSQFI